MRVSPFAMLGLVTSACVSLGAPRLTPEGMVAFAPPNAATQAAGSRPREQDSAPQPAPHVARSAYDRWRPPPLGILPPEGILRNTSEPVSVRAGDVQLTLRASDRLVPAWGGDFYVRVDLTAQGRRVAATARDLVVVIDTRDAPSLRRAQRMAAAVFESLRAGDRGALVVTSTFGRVIVPLMSYGAAPLLIERTLRIEAEGHDDLAGALERAVPMLEGDSRRLRRLVLLSGSGDLIRAETRQWLEVADRAAAEVRLVPLTPRASRRFEGLAGATAAIALPEVATTDQAENAAIEELAALPESEYAANDVTLVVEAEPGPMHLVEVSGGNALWTPNGSELPIGSVRVGDQRTVVLRGLVPPWRAGEAFDVTLRVRYRASDGPHEQTRRFRARYSGSPDEHGASRAGDVLQYVSLLNTLSRVQAALATHDDSTLDSIRAAGLLQSRSLLQYAAQHRDEPMLEQATLLGQLLRLQ